MRDPYKCPYCGRPYRVLPPKVLGGPHTYVCDCERFVAEENAIKASEERKRREYEQRIRREYVESMDIPKRFLKAEPDPQTAADVLANGGLFMYGKSGRGKTHRACSVLLGLVDLPNRPSSAKFVNMPRLFIRIKDTFGGNGTEGSVTEPYRTCGLLVIDDLGKGKQTDWALEKLFVLIDDRYNDELPTIVTTQHDWHELGSRLSMSGDSDTAEAILSRLSEMCRTMHFGGPDLRLRQGG